MTRPDPESPTAAAVLVAAGGSVRMGLSGGPRKPFLKLAGRALIERACEAFEASALVQEIVLVGHAQDLERLRELSRRSASMAKVGVVVAGGATRAESVRQGVTAVRPGVEVIAIHDAARPLVGVAVVELALRVAARSGAAVVALPATDTVKISSDGEHVERTLDRSVVWLAQTPQVFRAEVLRDLLLRAEKDGFAPTDEAALYEKYVGGVALVRGEATNLKVTTPADLELAAAILRARREREVRGS